jgi:hypothetical protein
MEVDASTCFEGYLEKRGEALIEHCRAGGYRRQLMIYLSESFPVVAYDVVGALKMIMLVFDKRKNRVDDRIEEFGSAFVKKRIVIRCGVNREP